MPTKNVVDRTESLCPICLKKISAEVILDESEVCISKKCEEHGLFVCPHAWDEPILYEAMVALSTKKTRNGIKDATIDITHKCNMRCPFCFNTAKNEPMIEYILERAKDWGRGNILLYGGEPTLRRDLVEIIRKLRENGHKTILLTNGLNLTKSLAKELDSAGLDGVLLQMDSLNDDVNERMRGMKLVDKKMQAIESLKETRIRLSFFVVVMKGINEDQISNILSLIISKPENFRAVIFSPLSPEGCAGFNRTYFSISEIFKEIEKFGMTIDDFIVTTKFEVELTNFLGRVGVKRRSIALCEAVCYAYIKKGHIIPLNRVIDLSTLSKVMEDSDSLLSFVLNLIKKRFKFDVGFIPIMSHLVYSFMKSLTTGRPLNDNIPNIFGVVVNPSQNRYNADYRFLETCNLYSDNDSDFFTFCENNIFTTGKKDINSLDWDHIRKYSQP